MSNPYPNSPELSSPRIKTLHNEIPNSNNFKHPFTGPVAISFNSPEHFHLNNPMISPDSKPITPQHQQQQQGFQFPDNHQNDYQQQQYQGQNYQQQQYDQYQSQNNYSQQNYQGEQFKYGQPSQGKYPNQGYQQQGQQMQQQFNPSPHSQRLLNYDVDENNNQNYQDSQGYQEQMGHQQQYQQNQSQYNQGQQYQSQPNQKRSGQQQQQSSNQSPYNQQIPYQSVGSPRNNMLKGGQMNSNGGGQILQYTNYSTNQQMMSPSQQSITEIGSPHASAQFGGNGYQTPNNSQHHGNNTPQQYQKVIPKKNSSQQRDHSSRQQQDVREQRAQMKSPQRDPHQSKSGYGSPRNVDLRKQSTQSNIHHNQSGVLDKSHNETLNASMTSRATSKRRLKPVVVMNIDIGGGRKEEIQVYENDEPEQVAQAFCQKHKLPSKVAGVLTKNITAQVNNFYQLKKDQMDKKNKSILSHISEQSSRVEDTDRGQNTSMRMYNNQNNKTKSPKYEENDTEEEETYMHQNPNPNRKKVSGSGQGSGQKGKQLKNPGSESKKQLNKQSMQQIQLQQQIKEQVELQKQQRARQQEDFEKNYREFQARKNEQKASKQQQQQQESEGYSDQQQYNDPEEEEQYSDQDQMQPQYYSEEQQQSDQEIPQIPQKRSGQKTKYHQEQQQYYSSEQNSQQPTDEEQYVDQTNSHHSTIPKYQTQNNNYPPSNSNTDDDQQAYYQQIPGSKKPMTPNNLSRKQSTAQSQAMMRTAQSPRDGSKEAAQYRYEKWSGKIQEKRSKSRPKQLDDQSPLNKSSTSHHRTEREMVIPSNGAKKKNKRSLSSKSTGNLRDESDEDMPPSAMRANLKNAKKLATNRLYEDGLRDKKAKEEMLQRKKSLKDQQELRDATFKPTINKNSAKMAKKKQIQIPNQDEEVEVKVPMSSRGDRRPNYYNEQQLSYYAQQQVTSGSDLEEQQQYYSEENAQGYDYSSDERQFQAPQSARVRYDENQQAPIYERLHKEAQNKALKKKKVEEDFYKSQQVTKKPTKQRQGEELTYNRLYNEGKQKQLASKRKEVAQVNVNQGQKLAKKTPGRERPGPLNDVEQTNTSYGKIRAKTPKGINASTTPLRNKSGATPKSSRPGVVPKKTGQPPKLQNHGQYSKTGMNMPQSARNQKPQPEVIHVQLSRNSSGSLSSRQRGENGGGNSARHYKKDSQDYQSNSSQGGSYGYQTQPQQQYYSQPKPAQQKYESRHYNPFGEGEPQPQEFNQESDGYYDQQDYGVQHQDSSYPIDIQQGGQRQQQRMQQQKSQSELVKKTTKPPKINSVDSFDNKVLSDIFENMDDDKDGLISAECVDVSKIDTDVLELISEVIFALDDDKILDFQAFSEIVRGLDVLPKLRDMYGYKETTEEEYKSSDESDHEKTSTAEGSSEGMNTSAINGLKYDDSQSHLYAKVVDKENMPNMKIPKKYQQIITKKVMNQQN